jgi:hypothetical protein
MLTIIDKLKVTVVICLLGIAQADPAIADKSLSVPPVPPSRISIKQLGVTFAVPPTAPEVSAEYVRQQAITYFVKEGVPELIGICECESHFVHYHEDGTLNVSMHKNAAGKRDSSASGVCQILYKGHYKNWSQSPGTNITTLEGNLAFAAWLYKTEGSEPWKSSRSCWKNKRYDMRVASIATS